MSTNNAIACTRNQIRRTQVPRILRLLLTRAKPITCYAESYVVQFEFSLVHFSVATHAMSSNNLYIVTSTDHFKELLSADLKRVSLISFWASWVEACGQMNEVVVELANKYPELLVLQVRRPPNRFRVSVD